MAIQHTITDEGTHVKIETTGMRPRLLRLNKHTHDIKLLQTGSPVPVEFIRVVSMPDLAPVIDIYYDNVLVPATADISALEAEIGPYFFNLPANGGGYAEMTLSELQTAIIAATLTLGQHIFVTDLADAGAWFLATSTSTVAIESEGLFLNCDWANEGGIYSGVDTITGLAYAGTNYGQWNRRAEAFVVEYTALGGGSFAVGDQVEVSGGWVGIITDVSTPGQFMAYTTTLPLPVATDHLQVVASGVTADVTVVNANPLVGNVVCYLDASNTYRHYQCIDELTLDGPDPEHNSSYMVLPRALDTGYLLVSDATEWNVDTGWLNYRRDATANEWRYSENMDNVMAFGSNPLGMWPWGKPNVFSNSWDDCLAAIPNPSATSIIGNKAGPGAKVGAVLGIDSTFSKNRVDPYVETGMDVAANSAVESNHFQYNWKAKTVNGVVSNMTVTEADEDTETVTYPTWTKSGRRRKVVTLIDVDLFGITTPIVFLTPANGTVDYFYDYDFQFQYIEGGSPYTAPSNLLVTTTAGDNISSITNALFAGGDRFVNATLARSTLTAGFPAIARNESFQLSSASAITGGNGVVKLVVEYRNGYFL